MTTLDVKANSLAKQVFKKSTLAVCVAALATQAYAQQDTASTEPTTLEEVVIYGVKQSLINAQDIKRDGATVKDVITSSDIGALPDKSIVEALQRVPGVAIERFEASNDPDHFSVEGGGVTVRGLNRVRAEFNGRDGFSAGADGGLNFSDIPPEMVGAVEVYKNQTADMVEGGIAGTINLVTRKPFDSDELVMGGTVRASYGDLIEEITPSFSGVASNVWDTDIGKFGALISLSASEFTSRGDGVGVYNFYDNERFEGGAAGRDYWAPAGGSARQQENERDRLGFSTALQWANPSETLQATLEFIHSDSELTWTERFVEYADQPFVDSAGGGNLHVGDAFVSESYLEDLPEGVSRENMLDSIGSGATWNCPGGANDITGVPCQFTSGVIRQSAAANGSPYYVAGTRARTDKRVIDDISFNLEYAPNENLTLTGDIQHTTATNEIYDATAHGKFYSDIYMDLRHDDNARLEYIDDSVSNASSYFMRSALDFRADSEGEQTAVGLDGEYLFDQGWVTGVKAGVRFSNKTLDFKETNYNWGSLGETWMDPGPMTYDQYVDSGLVEQFSFENHFKDSALQGNNTFWFPSAELLTDTGAMYEQLREQRGDADTDRILRGSWMPLHERPQAIDGTAFRPSDLAQVEEDRSAIYVRVDFGDDDAALRYSGNIGVRYVDWQLSSTGANVFGNYDEVFSEEVGYFLNPPSWHEYNNLPQAQKDENLELYNQISEYLDQEDGVPYTVEGENFTRALPSFNLKVELTEDVIIRFAASESIYMPDLTSVRNSRTVTPNLNVIRGEATAEGGEEPIADVELIGYSANGAGNPNLQPELSANYDVAFEWYFSDLGSFTSTFFYKRIRDYFRQSSTIETLANGGGIENDVVVTNTQNAGTATIQGYELAYQSSFGFVHEALDDFGVQTSYTFIDGSSTNSGDAQLGGDPGSKYSRQFTYNNFNDLPLEGLSQDNYNVALFYDNGTLQSRFAYSWRSDYLLNSRDVIAFAPVFGESTGQLDASVSWQINDNFKVGLEANNLLGEVTRTSILNETTPTETREYNQQGIRTPRSYFANDRRFALFLQANY